MNRKAAVNMCLYNTLITTCCPKKWLESTQCIDINYITNKEQYLIATHILSCIKINKQSKSWKKLFKSIYYKLNHEILLLAICHKSSRYGMKLWIQHFMHMLNEDLIKLIVFGCNDNHCIICIEEFISSCNDITIIYEFLYQVLTHGNYDVVNQCLSKYKDVCINYNMNAIIKRPHLVELFLDHGAKTYDIVRYSIRHQMDNSDRVSIINCLYNTDQGRKYMDKNLEQILTAMIYNKHYYLISCIHIKKWQKLIINILIVSIRNENMLFVEFLENNPDYIPALTPYTIALLNEDSDSVLRNWCLNHCVYTTNDCKKMTIDSLLSFAHMMNVIITEDEFEKYIVPKCEFSVDENYLKNQML